MLSDEKVMDPLNDDNREEFSEIISSDLPPSTTIATNVTHNTNGSDKVNWISDA